jgi:3-methyladenine DNA glycosylase/8-oxoguanine DNA glycosylase
LQENRDIIQNLYDIENDLENAKLTPEQQKNLRETVRNLQKYSKNCYDSYSKALRDHLDIQCSLSDIEKFLTRLDPSSEESQELLQAQDFAALVQLSASANLNLPC